MRVVKMTTDLNTTTNPKDVTDFRFRSNNCHNRDMLEYQAEKAFKAGAFDLAAHLAIAAGLYMLAGIGTKDVQE
jgi:hypothetical protein